MKKWALIVLACASAGCSSDSARSLSREYRNINNEAIDSLMMVNSEWRAKLAKDKIFKPYSEHLTNLDTRFEKWKQNTDDTDVIRDTLSEFSVAILISEIPINTKHLDYERKRLQKLLDAKTQDEVERRRQAGEANPVVDAAKEWPSLNDLVVGSTIAPLAKNLEQVGGFAKLVATFETDQKYVKARPKDYKELRDMFNDRVEKLALR